MDSAIGCWFALGWLVTFAALVVWVRALGRNVEQMRRNSRGLFY